VPGIICTVQSIHCKQKGWQDIPGAGLLLVAEHRRVGSEDAGMG